MSGRLIGNYRIVDYVGSGGFGSVFRAEDIHTAGRIVAIKELHKKHTRNAVIKQRFFQEAVAMARLDHPNLPKLFTFGEDDGSYYLVMEFIEGKLLSDEIRDSGTLDSGRAIAIITQVLEAVSYAHTNGIIHRDLKPDNIMLMSDGALRIRVLDFGIARMIGGENLTVTGEGFGTPAYMSPERISGTAPVDKRTDIYSLGIILVEMITGQAPFHSRATDPLKYWFEMRKLHESEELPELASLGVPAALERVIRKAAAKQPDDRYETASEMLADIKDLSGGVTQSPSVIRTCSLMLTTQPGSAEVFIDDVRRGMSDETKGKLLITNVASGLRGVRVSKAGYDDYKISLALEEGHQTDLQVALAARKTLAFPQVESEASPVTTTKDFQGSDDADTAVFVVESIPAGSTVFVGTRAVALADADGRAVVALRPGVHQVQVSDPSGALAQRELTVTDEDTGSRKVITMAVAQAAPTTTPIRSTGREPSQGRRWIAMVVATVVLAALAVATYFAVRGPTRHDSQTSELQAQSTGGGDPPIAEAPETTASTSNSNKQIEPTIHPPTKQPAKEGGYPEKPNSAEAPRKGETVTPPKETPAVNPLPEPATPDNTQAPQANNQGACVGVEVTRPDGQPAQGLTVVVAGVRGQTNAAGRLRQCGLTPGAQARVLVFGPAGAMVASVPIFISPGPNFVPIRLVRRGPNRGGDQPANEPPFRPRRRPPAYRPPY